MHTDDDPGKSISTRELIYRFLLDYKRQHDGNTPSTREIAEGCSVGLSTAKYHLLMLELEGRIRIWRERPRRIEIVGGQWGIESAADEHGPDFLDG